MDGGQVIDGDLIALGTQFLGSNRATRYSAFQGVKREAEEFRPSGRRVGPRPVHSTGSRSVVSQRFLLRIGVASLSRLGGRRCDRSGGLFTVCRALSAETVLVALADDG